MAILGIDEVGRGPLAGPLVVGAVALPEGVDGEWPEWAARLKDSKKLSAKRREELSEIILREAPAVGLGWVLTRELDEVGISAALRLATRRAVEEVQGQHVKFNQIVIDGKVNFLGGTALEKYVSVMPKADDLIKEVSAASIVAKVARDRYMQKLAEKYPGYDFEKNVGYGTARHMAAIREIGISPEHRRSFEPIRSMVGYERAGVVQVARKNTTKIGLAGESAVCDYLARQGHMVVARNFKTERCEIDVVSVCAGKIYFTEVKTRKNDFAGGGLMAVDAKKLRQMKFAAEVFLLVRKEYAGYDPMLAVAAVDGTLTVTDWVPLEY